MKKKLYKIPLIVLGFVVYYYVSTCAYGESSKCLMVYKEGGAPAVFQSPKCPLWELSNYASRRHRTERCQSALHQGRRKSQEDRIFCNLDVRIPFPGPAGLLEVTVGILAVFDGHNGAEASEMSSKLLLEYFLLHTHFLLDTTFSILSKQSMGRLPSKGEHNVVFKELNSDEPEHVSDRGRFKLTLSAIFDGSFHLEILKESLLRAINDIDTTFSKEASRNNIGSGSTATVILIVDDQIFVANIGDSKALLCSETILSPPEAKAALLRLYRQKRHDGALSPITKNNRFKVAASNGLTQFSAKELTRDHHPDRADERSRVESYGGYVLEWGGVSRVNGQLAVSRAIGDVSFKSYGVISAPDVTEWQPLSGNDSYLVAATDGIFEKLSPQDVCDVLWELDTHGTVRSEISPSCSYSLSDCIVDLAYKRGSMDNMAVVVVPFTSTGFSQSPLKERCAGEGEIDCSASRLQKFKYEQSDLEHDYPVMAKFDRLLVEGKHSSFGCFYLSENLSDNVNYTFGVRNVDQQDVYDMPPALPKALDHHCGGPLSLYNDQNLCLHFGLTVNGGRDQCLNPEGFASFLGLLGSIPMHDMGSDYGSFEHAMPDSRYILKKRFDRGAYGEVWLAFPWNCSEGSNASTWGLKNKTFSFNAVHVNSSNRASEANSSAQDCNAPPPDDIMVILKRIMVERGSNVYLSGLREKYFGEVFLNASTFLGGSLSAGIAETVSKASRRDLYDQLKSNLSVAHETSNTWNFENVIPNKKRLLNAAYEEGLSHIARYIESFESRSNEIWLVFRHEGVSLSKLLYTAEEINNNADEGRDENVRHVQVLRPSKWWHWLKTTEAGQKEMCDLIRQLLMALKSCHDRNITHRDIKPENMVVCFEDQDSGRCLKGSPSGDKNYTTRMRIIDFGSAMDKFTMKHLYGSVGPSRAEQTDEYAPPEAFLNASWYLGPTSTTLKYDMWSVGVVMLELILGSPDVFYINAFTRALLDQYLDGWNEGIKELAYKLRSFMEMCILIPGSSSKLNRFWGTKDQGEVPVSWKCSEEFFSRQIKSRDPLQIGFPNVWALRLVRQLLLWDPEDRLSVDDALRHPYFQHPPQR